MKSFPVQVAILCTLLTAASASPPAESKRKSVTFDERGVIVDVNTFFFAATGVGQSAASPDVLRESVAGKALVTESGVYGFLETPDNERMLAQTSNGSVVQVKGKLLREGALLHVDELQSKTQVPLIDFASYRTDRGREVELKGVNKCQCGLDVGDLPHSCEIGHLHHLETLDGQIYHYLQFARGEDFFLGKGSHFKPLSVKARLLPGHYIMVTAATVGE